MQRSHWRSRAGEPHRWQWLQSTILPDRTLGLGACEGWSGSLLRCRRWRWHCRAWEEDFVVGPAVRRRIVVVGLSTVLLGMDLFRNSRLRWHGRNSDRGMGSDVGVFDVQSLSPLCQIWGVGAERFRHCYLESGERWVGIGEEADVLCVVLGVILRGDVGSR